MATTVAILGPTEVFEAKVETFAGYEIGLVREHGKARWISIATILKALPGIEGNPIWQRYTANKRTLTISYGNKVSFQSDCIPRVDFFSVTQAYPPAYAFRDAVSAILERLDDGEVVSLPDPETDGDVNVRMVTALLTTVRDVAKIKARQDRLEADNQLTRQIASDAHNIAETSLELQVGTGNRRKGIPELGRRGYRFTTLQYGAVGGELRRIALRILDPLDSFPKVQWNNDAVNTHIPETFDIWEKECGHKYRRK